MRQLQDMLESIPFDGPSRFDREMQAKADGARSRRDIVMGLDLPITDADEQRLIAREWRDTPAMVTAHQWTCTHTPFLLMCSTPGTGKTFAACAALVEREGKGQYITAREVERIALARYGPEVEDWKAVLRQPFLVVDELGRERDKGIMSEALCELLDNRRKRARRTILISNLPRSPLMQRYPDKRLASRLEADGACVWMSEKGDDLR